MTSTSGEPEDGWGGSTDLSGFKRYYRTVRQHLGLVVACVVITLAAADVYATFAPRTYTAVSELLINPASQQEPVLFALPVLHMSGDPVTDVLTAASLVTTPQVADAVANTTRLGIAPTALLGKVQVTPLAQSNIIAVQATGSTPSQAQKIADAFATQVIAVRTAGLHRALALLIPTLRAQVAALPPAERGGIGTLGSQLGQLEQLQRGSDPTISVAAPAVLPTGPTSPRRNLALAAGLLSGLLIGIGAAFGFDALDPRLQREEQVRKVARGAPIVARIPHVRRRSKRRPLVPTELTMAAMEQYRMLRASLSMRPSSRSNTQGGSTSGRSTNRSQAYLVTGSSPAEGKTTSAISLAAVLARGHDDVILIEADLRRPTIGNSLGLDSFIGTEQVLAGETDLRNALVEVTAGGVEFRVLAAHPSGSSAELLSFASAERLVGEAKKLAKFVVIDSPPLTAVIDALPFAVIANHVVVTVRVGHSRINRLSDLFELLARHGTSASAVVLIGSTEYKAPNYGYYSDQLEQSGLVSGLQDPVLPADGSGSQARQTW